MLAEPGPMKHVAQRKQFVGTRTAGTDPSGNCQPGRADGQEPPVGQSLLLLRLCGLLPKLYQLGCQIICTKLLNGFLQIIAGLHLGLCLL
jgi:hypothetical protein